MQFLPEILLFCLLIFLYCLFVFTKEDFILLRKNVTLEQLFNMSFIGFIIVLFFGRSVYIVEYFNKKYLDPLVFFVFFYFPGLSFAGGIAGGLLYMWYFCKKKNFPFGRIFDIASLSFLLSLSVGMFFFFIGSIFFIKKELFSHLGASALFLFVFILLFIIFSRGSLKDGSTGFLSNSFVGLCLLSLNILSRNKSGTLVVPDKKFMFLFSPEDISLGIIFLIFLIFFFRNETVRTIYRKVRKT